MAQPLISNSNYWKVDNTKLTRITIQPIKIQILHHIPLHKTTVTVKCTNYQFVLEMATVTGNISYSPNYTVGITHQVEPGFSPQAPYNYHSTLEPTHHTNKLSNQTRRNGSGSRTLAPANEEVPVGCDGAVEEVHHRPRVPVAHERHRHLLLIHPFPPKTLTPAARPHRHSAAAANLKRRDNPSPIKKGGDSGENWGSG